MRSARPAGPWRRRRLDDPAGPASPERLPVEPLTLTASGRQPEQPRRSPPHRRRGASIEARAALMVRSTATGRQPARRAAATSPQELAARDAAGCPRVGRETAFRGRRGPRAEQRTADGVQRGVAVGVAMEAGRARRSRHRRARARRRARRREGRSRTPFEPRLAVASPGCASAALPSTRQPCRGWAKTMRPATVWRTRVTVTSTSLSIDFAPPSTTTIVPSSR